MAEVRYTEEAVVEAPLEDVYDYRLDYEHTLPEYNPNVSNIHRTDGRTELGVGAEYAFDVEIPGMGQMQSTLTVMEAVAPSRIVNRMGSGMFEATETCSFERVEDGTRVQFEVTVSFPEEMAAVAELAERSGRDQVRLELDLMRKQLEGGS